jgi:hypothetical protein
MGSNIICAGDAPQAHIVIFKEKMGSNIICAGDAPIV